MSIREELPHTQEREDILPEGNTLKDAREYLSRLVIERGIKPLPNDADSYAQDSVKGKDGRSEFEYNCWISHESGDKRFWIQANIKDEIIQCSDLSEQEMECAEDSICHLYEGEDHGAAA